LLGEGTPRSGVQEHAWIGEEKKVSKGEVILSLIHRASPNHARTGANKGIIAEERILEGKVTSLYFANQEGGRAGRGGRS